MAGYPLINNTKRGKMFKKKPRKSFERGNVEYGSEIRGLIKVQTAGLFKNNGIGVVSYLDRIDQRMTPVVSNHIAL